MTASRAGRDIGDALEGATQRRFRIIALVVTIGAIRRWGQPEQALIAIASVLYIVGCAGVTMVCNVPLNDALAAVQPGTENAGIVWGRFLKDWTFWNHVRTLASTGACALYDGARG